jgi:hypothetical protein
MSATIFCPKVGALFRPRTVPRTALSDREREAAGGFSYSTATMECDERVKRRAQWCTRLAIAKSDLHGPRTNDACIGVFVLGLGDVGIAECNKQKGRETKPGEHFTWPEIFALHRNSLLLVI